jgi:hypothetical protein
VGNCTIQHLSLSTPVSFPCGKLYCHQIIACEKNSWIVFLPIFEKTGVKINPWTIHESTFDLNFGISGVKNVSWMVHGTSMNRLANLSKCNAALDNPVKKDII